MHYVPLQFPWHFAVRGRNNCLVLVSATVLNREAFQPIYNVVAELVMRLSADFTEYFCLQKVTEVCIQSLSMC